MHRVAVVGAGIGGLSAALSLQSKGMDVTVFERLDSPGGKLHQQSIGTEQIDSGPTVFTLKPVFDRLFAQANHHFEDEVDLLKTELIARHSWVDRSTLDLFSNVEQSAAVIETFASARDAQNYRRFADESKNVFDLLDKTFMQAQQPGMLELSLGHGLKHALCMPRIKPFKTLWSHVASSFDDPRLQQLFARYSTYCGSSPYLAPATLMLIAHAERDGVYQLRDGMHALATAMVGVFQKLGGDIRYSKAIKSIETSNNSVTGLRLEDESLFETSTIVYNGDTEALTRGLLGDKVERSLPSRKVNSLSALTKCLIAKPRGFELAHHNVFFGNDYKSEFDSIFKHGQTTQHPTVYICAQDRGPELATSKEDSAANTTAEKIFCLVNAPSTKNAEDTNEEIARQAEQGMLSTLARHGLELEEFAERSVVTTPADFAAQFPGSDGALYGSPTHGWAGSFKRPGSRCRVKGLYLAGGSVHPGPGLPMVAISGQLAAEALLSDL